ncbi:MAG: hypothetical protein IPM98_00320 [Lewinellaceae bacterium]|nr:hypothetical protein [Lewinellaceae bacterium]
MAIIMTVTNIQAQKLALIQDILALEDEKILLLVRTLKAHWYQGGAFGR